MIFTLWNQLLLSVSFFNCIYKNTLPAVSKVSSWHPGIRWAKIVLSRVSDSLLRHHSLLTNYLCAPKTSHADNLSGADRSHNTGHWIHGGRICQDSHSADRSVVVSLSLWQNTGWSFSKIKKQSISNFSTNQYRHSLNQRALLFLLDSNVLGAFLAFALLCPKALIVRNLFCSCNFFWSDLFA